MSTFIGIDPGGTGGIAVILPLGDVYVIPTPMAGDEIDGHGVAEWLMGYVGKETYVCIEKVGAMPKQGLSSTFKFGERTGIMVGICQALGFSIMRISPQKWKKLILCGRTHDKDGAIAWCRSTYPHVKLVLPRCRVAHDGMCDALCMAAYAQRVTLTCDLSS